MSDAPVPAGQHAPPAACLVPGCQGHRDSLDTRRMLLDHGFSRLAADTILAVAGRPVTPAADGGQISAEAVTAAAVAIPVMLRRAANQLAISDAPTSVTEALFLLADAIGGAP